MQILNIKLIKYCRDKMLFALCSAVFHLICLNFSVISQPKISGFFLIADVIIVNVATHTFYYPCFHLYYGLYIFEFLQFRSYIHYSADTLITRTGTSTSTTNTCKSDTASFLYWYNKTSWLVVVLHSILLIPDTNCHISHHITLLLYPSGT
jgi:hypothetical protein